MGTCLEVPWRSLEVPGGSEVPGFFGGPWRSLEFKKTVVELVLHFQFKFINGVKAVKILVDARKRSVNV